jgi:hypothetical protein
MSDTPRDESHDLPDEVFEEEVFDEVSKPTPTVSRVPARVSSQSRTGWMAPVALVLSLLAAGASGWALFKPAPEPTTIAADAKSDDPKATVCKAFKTVSDAVFFQTNRSPSQDLGPAIPAALEAIAANARLAMSEGSSYLLAHLPSNAPEELAKEARNFAGELSSIAMNALAGIPNDKPEQAELLKSAEKSNTKIGDLCK